MEVQELITNVYQRTLPVLDRALQGLTQDDLNEQPHPDCNSIGWLVWHLTRVQDTVIASIRDEEQLWIRDKWYAKFNRPADSQDNGGGQSSEDVAAFKSPGVDTLLGYHRSVLELSQSYLTGLSTADLDRELTDPRFKTPPTVAQMLIIVIGDNLQHAGQVAYLRGLLKGKGWM